MRFFRYSLAVAKGLEKADILLAPILSVLVTHAS